MTKFEKYSVKSLANQMFCLPLSLPRTRGNAIISTYNQSFETYSRCTSTSRSRGFLAELGGTSLFYILNLCSTCQEPTQAFKRGIIVPATHLVHRIYPSICTRCLTTLWGVRNCIKSLSMRLSARTTERSRRSSTSRAATAPCTLSLPSGWLSPTFTSTTTRPRSTSRAFELSNLNNVKDD